MMKRKAAASIATLIAASTLWVGVTAVTAPAEAAAATGITDCTVPGWDVAGYSGTDDSLAQYDWDFGLPLEGYGVDPSKVGDHSHPYGWRGGCRPVPAQVPAAFPHNAAEGTYVNTADGVAEWVGGQWVFCPIGWSDTQCGA